MRLWALLACATLARADILHLKNGNELEGVITSQSNSQVTLDFGYGSTVVDRSDIERITRSPKGAGAREVRRRRYEAGLAVPSGAETVDALYRETQALREKALEARARSAELQEEARALQDSIPGREADYRSAAARLQRLSPADPAYNRAVGEVNGAATAIQSDTLRLKEIERLVQKARGHVSAYLTAYRKLEDHLAGPGASLLKSGGEYAAWLKGELKTMRGDLQRDDVAADRKGASLFVNVLINGVPARLLVDTGASSTLLYSEIAEQLRLPAGARLGRAQASTADGRSVDVEVVRLDSIELGRSRVENSQAFVSPARGQGFDGLLGMSFLGKFVVRVDAANGRLILEDLKPRR